MSKASSLGASIEKAFPGTTVEISPGGKGDFVVTADGRKLWDKRNMGDQFPEHRVILDALKVGA